MMQNSQQRAWVMLPIRLILFAGLQALLALAFFLVGKTNAWDLSTNWWPLVVFFANMVCLFLLIRFYKAEGDRFWNIFKFQRDTVGKDLLALLGFLIVAGPIGFLPNIMLGNLLFGDMSIATEMFLRPLPMWAVIASILLFPATQGLVEIPTYMMYVMPRIEKGGA
ncbi:hypothetical protein EG832_08350, partial [bacterium]|nr:hypothetical protein [bacterium]